MPTFVHICQDSDVKRIKRAGILVQKRRRGVYAMPVTPDFYVSHQWARELRRWRPGPLAALYMRIPGNTPVLYGHYLGPHTDGTADSAAAALMKGDVKLGFEAIILADIPAAAILRARQIRPITGWRYYPTAKGRAPCLPGARRTLQPPLPRALRERG